MSCPRPLFLDRPRRRHEDGHASGDQDDNKGVATFDGLTPGRYSITAEFPGFELGLLRDIRINRGDNKHVVVLPLRGRAESVTVGPDGQAAAATRSNTDFGLSATKEQIDALSDDPAEMQRQILEIAGPDAVIRVDSFEGQQLPPKSQIKSIHVTRDQFAAETAGWGPCSGRDHATGRGTDPRRELLVS